MVAPRKEAWAESRVADAHLRYLQTQISPAKMPSPIVPEIRSDQKDNQEMLPFA